LGWFLRSGGKLETARIKILLKTQTISGILGWTKIATNFMVIGFWNINCKNLSDNLIDFVTEQQIDILVLAEIDDNTILEFLTKSRAIHKNQPFSRINNHNTVALLSKYNADVFPEENRLVSRRWLIYSVNIPTVICFNLACVHFHSKVNWAKESLALECVNFSRDISIVEDKTGCDETILIGDFNMNPFEDGIVAANGLNAIQDLEYVSKNPNGRNIDGIDYKYFYNPMWNFFGDFKKPLGTHYCRPGGHISQEWNIYDQIMFRGTIKKYLDNNDYVKIIDEIRSEKIITKEFGRPKDAKYSDHLPIVLKLRI